MNSSYVLEMRKLDIVERQLFHKERRLAFEQQRYITDMVLRMDCTTPDNKQWQISFLRLHASLMAGQKKPNLMHDARSLCRKYGVELEIRIKFAKFLAKVYRAKYRRHPMQRKLEARGHAINVYSNVEITELEEAIYGFLEAE